MSSKWWDLIKGKKKEGATVINISEAFKAKRLDIINSASKDFYPHLNNFYLKWGYDTTLKILAGYSARLIASAKDKDKDLTQFIAIVQYRVKYFEDENRDK